MRNRRRCARSCPAGSPRHPPRCCRCRWIFPAPTRPPRPTPCRSRWTLRRRARWTGSRALLVDLRGHGREAIFDDLDVTRTVGWFTTVYPLIVPVTEPLEPDAVLQAVKARLRSIPRSGIGYGLLRYLGTDAAV